MRKPTEFRVAGFDPEIGDQSGGKGDGSVGSGAAGKTKAAPGSSKGGGLGLFGSSRRHADAAAAAKKAGGHVLVLHACPVGGGTYALGGSR